MKNNKLYYKVVTGDLKSVCYDFADEQEERFFVVRLN